jgi:hypothetical protein
MGDPMSWPDAQNPGAPADPARPWHWVSRAEERGALPLPVQWNPHLRQWSLWDGSTLGAEEAARRFAYLGPCLTPAETEARIAESIAAATPPAPPPEPGPLRGLAALAASSEPDPPPAMVYRKHAVRNHLLIFAGTLFGTLFLVDSLNLMR